MKKRTIYCGWCASAFPIQAMTYQESAQEVAMNEADDLKQICEDVLEFLSPSIDGLKTFEWDGDISKHSWELLKRAIVVRQYEALQSIVKMVEGGFGHFGVTLLRPAYEELLWVEYLSQNQTNAQELILLLAANEMKNSLEAQNNFVGKVQMNNMGFTQKFVKQTSARAKETKSKIKTIGGQLGWRQGSILPTVAHIALKLSRKTEYDFLYQGTSRSVHFSPHELLRRIWGNQGEVSIGSDSFTHYWSDFALSWGSRILVETVLAVGETIDFSIQQETEFDAFLDTIKKIRPVQILTSTELKSWDSLDAT